MKEKEWINGDKMKFESEFSTFNRQTNCISRGNCIANTQLSSYVRPFSETECNGFKREPGHLQNWDLNEGFAQRFPDFVKKWIRDSEYCKTKSVIAYEFFYYTPGENRIPIGWVITSGHDDGYKLLNKWYADHKSKFISALDECILYITN